MAVQANKENYIEMLQGLFSGDEYFVRLEQSNGRGDYWNPSIDPDGIQRDAANEFNKWTTNNYELFSLCKAVISELELNANILDFGCGPGHLISNLRDESSEDKLFFAYDSSLTARKYLNKNQIHVSDQPSQIKDNFYDLIILNHVIEHLDNPVEIVSILTSPMKSNGQMIIGTPDFLSPSAQLFRDRYRMLHEPTHISLFSLDSLLRMMRELGLQIEQRKNLFGTRMK